MERNYTKIWWQHCLAIVGFSVVPLFIVSISLYLLFNKIYTEKVLENLQNRVEARRDTVDLFLSERIAQIYTVANTKNLKTFQTKTISVSYFRLCTPNQILM